VFAIATTDCFLRRARKFLRKHPDLRERFAEVVDDLKEDPFAPHLAYHHRGGKLKDVQAVSITYDYRMILTIEIAEHEIILLDIGSHDEVNR
jgi:mRNA-degrading endonuclease YafQ of YafQ-DinJ toxin-antitoxin module